MGGQSNEHDDSSSDCSSRLILARAACSSFVTPATRTSKMHTVVLAGGGRAFVQASVEKLLVEGGTGPATSGQIRATGVVVNGVEVRAPLVISGMR